jgi:oligopeptide transport system substrate-binding protein
MNRNLIYFSVFSLLLSSCGGKQDLPSIAEGGKRYGGVFKFMSEEKVNNLLPIASIDVYAQRINGQIFESLLKLDPETMKVIPSIAESYTVSKDAKTFTFKIRKGVFFHDDECFGGSGREVTAEDIRFTLEMVCSGFRENKMAYLLVDRIEGAKDFQTLSKKKLDPSGISGVKVIDDQTIRIKLVKPFIGFDKTLCHINLGILAKEAYEKYGANMKSHPVGSGPFRLEKMDDKGIVLARNPHYWKKDEFGNQLPFLEKLEMTYVKDKRSELLAFRKKQIDIVFEIPVDDVENILGSLKEAQQGKNVKHRVESKPSLNMNYIGFACESEEFKDVNVRKAFNLAVDREFIVNHVLKGEGWPAVNGFVPPIENYHYENVIGFKSDIPKAKELLSLAGYPNGKGFPVLDFYVNAVEGSSKHKMCQGIADELKKNLNVTLNVKLCSIQERSKAIISGKAKIWRSGWIADYPDAENFLSLFYSKNIKDNEADVNAFRFKDSNFDQLFEIATTELDENKRNDLFSLCNQIITDKAPVMPIMTDDFMVMINARIRDFKTNSMEILDFSSVHIKESKK